MDELAGSFTPPLTIEVARADIDEKALRRDSPRELVLALAHAKADALLPRLAGAAADAAGGAYLITCDQVVLHDDVIREKPADADEARRCECETHYVSSVAPAHLQARPHLSPGASIPPPPPPLPA